MALKNICSEGYTQCSFPSPPFPSPPFPSPPLGILETSRPVERGKGWPGHGSWLDGGIYVGGRCVMKFSSKQRSSHQNHFHKRKNHQRYNNCINNTYPVVPTSTTGIVGSCECVVAPVATLLGCSLPRQAQPTQTKFRVWGPHSRDCSVMKNVVKADQNCQPKWSTCMLHSTTDNISKV